jgi:hypothetical protein
LTFNEIKDILTNKKDDGVQYVFGYKYKTDANGDFIRGTKTINFTYADGSDTNTDSDFTEKDGHGVVVAKGDKNFYFLVNDDNVQSATRGVAKTQVGNLIRHVQTKMATFNTVFQVMNGSMPLT